MAARFKDVNWNVGGQEEPWTNPSMDGAQLAVLMDLRDALKEIRNRLASLDALFHCGNFMRLPAKIDAICKNTDRKAKKKKSVVKK